MTEFANINYQNDLVYYSQKGLFISAEDDPMIKAYDPKS